MTPSQYTLLQVNIFLAVVLARNPTGQLLAVILCAMWEALWWVQQLGWIKP